MIQTNGRLIPFLNFGFRETFTTPNSDECFMTPQQMTSFAINSLKINQDTGFICKLTILTHDGRSKYC